MPFPSIARLCLSFGIAAACISPALAATCPPTPLGTIFTANGPPAMYSIPVLANRTPTTLVLDTGAFWSVLTQTVAGDLGNQTARRGGLGVGGTVIQTFVTLPQLVLDPRGAGLRLKNVDFIVVPDQAFSGRTSGTLAANLLTWADVELDPSGHQLKLYNPSDCGAGVVTWPHRALAVLPLTVTKSGRSFVPVGVEGHPAWATLDTGAVVTALDTGFATAQLGLHPGDAATPLGDPAVSIEGKRLNSYLHKVGVLTLPGVTFRDTVVQVLDNKLASSGAGRRSAAESGEPVSPVVLGMTHLRHLHLYIAYYAKLLYVTEADDDPKVTVTSTTPH